MHTDISVTIGSDPELMLVDTKQSKVVSSIPVIKRDKHNPVLLGDGIKMYSDNVLVEAAFPPANTTSTFLTIIRRTLVRMQEYLGERYFLLPKASHIYDHVELGPKPDIMKGELPVEWEIGCNPSWNVYSLENNVPPPFSDGMRTGSFHIHLGSEKLKTPAQKMDMIRLLDLYVGLASVIFDRDDTSLSRRLLYGRAGEFRNTPYGIEYRVLSNFALRNPRCVELVCDLIGYAVDRIRFGEAARIIKETDPALIQAAINQNNDNLAWVGLKFAKLPAVFLKRIEQNYDGNMYENWKI